ncbi:hypothetical protein ACHAXA_006131 [Cyclostephanos tholiformis]|uniref:Endonuclease/exonuclease/phosphatase domain-containing protein n=1 Tax=Cyclostephanos tholiformis TaxID=382380 RepID=A0ABD3RE20_9STRA
MLIVSWNVAGLKPALQRIHDDYCGGRVGGGGGGGGRASATATDPPPPSSSSSSSSHHRVDDANNPLGTFLRLHGNVDVLCLQEHKVPLKSLIDRTEPHRCSFVPGYESYWSTVSDPRCRGFNGVVTYARDGLVLGADSRPLGKSEFDDQGRCVMTDHGAFVLFNVYVPCGSDSTSLPRKMGFLHALRDAMDRQRDVHGKGVILVGDMNIALDGRDVHWEDRRVNVDEVLEEGRLRRLRQRRRRRRGGGGGEDETEDGMEDETNDIDIDDRDDDDEDDDVSSAWQDDVATHWDGIVAALSTLEALPRRTTNPSTGATFDRFRARVMVAAVGPSSSNVDDGGGGGGGEGGGGGGGGRSVMLGDYEDTVENALGRYNLDELTYSDPRTGLDVVYRKRNSVSVRTLSELMAKVCGVHWNEGVRRRISDSDFSGPNPDSPPLLWMRSLLDGENGMVDVFRHLYPNAEARFTCWHQFTQKRYTNEGTRIDYTLVDRSLMEYVEPLPPLPPNDVGCRSMSLLRCGGRDASHPKYVDVDPMGEEAALMAATACGLFESGTYTGGGIAPATRMALDTQFVGKPHTGILYTPPSYSDHVAVSLLMKDDLLSNRIGTSDLIDDGPTRKAQPHKRQRPISSFFSSGGMTSTSSSSLSSCNGFPPSSIAVSGEKRSTISGEMSE